MKRKLIKQGIGGCTIYLPKKWVDENGLGPGNEIEIESQGNNLILSSNGMAKRAKEIELDITDTRESIVRTLLLNAYRAGYDKITVSYKGSIDDILKIVNEQMIGFELFTIEDNKYSLESVAEPSLENFETMIQKQFFIMLEIIRGISGERVKYNDSKIKRSDNFLKRCLSKRVITSETSYFLWQFLSNLTHVSRRMYYYNKYLLDNKIVPSMAVEEMVKRIEEMIFMLQKQYLKRDVENMVQIHKTEKELTEKAFKMFKNENPACIHLLLYIIRQISITSSPLAGMIQVEMMKSKNNGSVSKGDG